MNIGKPEADSKKTFDRAQSIRHFSNCPEETSEAEHEAAVMGVDTSEAGDEGGVMGLDGNGDSAP